MDLQELIPFGLSVEILFALQPYVRTHALNSSPLKNMKPIVTHDTGRPLGSQDVALEESGLGDRSVEDLHYQMVSSPVLRFSTRTLILKLSPSLCNSPLD